MEPVQNMFHSAKLLKSTNFRVRNAHTVCYSTNPEPFRCGSLRLAFQFGLKGVLYTYSKIESWAKQKLLRVFKLVPGVPFDTDLRESI